MKKSEDVKPDVKGQPEVRQRAAFEFNLEELYMLIGSLLHIATALEGGKTPTVAHAVKARYYRTFAKRLDAEYARLHHEQNKNGPLAYEFKSEWRLAE